MQNPKKIHHALYNYLVLSNGAARLPHRNSFWGSGVLKKLTPHTAGWQKAPINIEKLHAHTALFYILILLLPTQLTKHFWPSFSFVSGIRIDYLSPTIYLTDIIILGILIIWGIERLFFLFRRISWPIFKSGIDKNSHRQDQQPSSNIKSLQRVNLYNYIIHGLAFLWRYKLIPKARNVNPKPNNTLYKLTLSTLFSTATNIGTTDDAKKTTDKLPKYSDNLSNSFQVSQRTLLIISVILLIAYIILNISQAAQPIIAFFKWLKAAEMGLLALYIIKTKPSLLVACCLLLVTSLLSALLAWAQFAKGGSIGGLLFWVGERAFSLNTPGIAAQTLPSPPFVSGKTMLRPYATFPHPNVLAGFLTATFPFLFLLNPLLRSSNFTRFLRSILVTFWITTIFITGSQAALLTSISIFFLFLSKKYKSLFIVLLFIFLLIFNFQSIFNQFSNLNLQLQNPSIVRRYELSIAALNMFKESPIIGIGLNNFIIRLPEFTKSTEPTFFLQPVHNIYLLILAEGGIVGFIIFLYILLNVIKPPIFNLQFFSQRLIRLWRTIFNQTPTPKSQIHNKLRVTCYVLRVTTGALLLLGLFDHYLLTIQQGMLLFVIIMAYMFKEVKQPRTT